MSAPSLQDVPLIILAGGRATRLGSAADNTPKFLMPVSDQLTFADVQLRWAREQGFRDIVLSIGYLGHQIESYCGNGERWDLHIHYVHDGVAPLGTGGAVVKCAATLPERSCWAVTYGDTLLSLNCQEAVAKAHASACPALMTVYRNQVPGHVCNAHFQDGRCLYDKKKPLPQWQHIDYGFLLLSSDFIQSFAASRPLDLATPLEALAHKGQLAAMETSERFWEIGSPAALVEFQRRLTP